MSPDLDSPAHTAPGPATPAPRPVATAACRGLSRTRQAIARRVQRGLFGPRSATAHSLEVKENAAGHYLPDSRMAAVRLAEKKLENN